MSRASVSSGSLSGDVVTQEADERPFWLHRPLIRWGLLFAFWTIVGVFYVGRYSVLMWMNDRPVDTGWMTMTLVGWWMWVWQTPVIWMLARRFPVERPLKWGHLGIHVAGALIVVTLATLLYTGLARLIIPEANADVSYATFLLEVLVSTLPFDLLLYGAVVGVAQGFAYYRQYRRREIRASQLKTQLARAQVKALKMQLHPHFLFNTLHAVSALMDQDVKASQRMLVLLSELLRLSLDNVDQQEVSLDQELAFVQRYLAVQRIRFGDSLEVDFNVEDGVGNARVPNLVLQPLVENAIKHGSAPEGHTSRLLVSAHTEGDDLILSVTDNGAGLPSGDGAPPTEGIGLRTTRERLHQLYGPEYRLRFEPSATGGLTVSVRLPFHTEIVNTVEILAISE
ncbi:MAG: histidine kinase [Bacteroidota bacterium]